MGFQLIAMRFWVAIGINITSYQTFDTICIYSPYLMDSCVLHIGILYILLGQQHISISVHRCTQKFRLHLLICR
mgnify:FL=1